jgi:hypothetical protein
MKLLIKSFIPKMIVFMLPAAVWVFLQRDFVFGHIPVNMDTNTIYGVTKFYFNNVLNGVIPLWEPFVSLGRPFYAIAICNLFNPVTQIVPILKLAGMNYAHAFVTYMVVYFFIGCAGFYFLAKEILKDRRLAYLAYVGLMFSSLGASMFTQFTFLEMIVPTIWFFFFLLSFFRRQTQGHFLGLTLAMMTVVSSYLPFYFMTVLFCFLLVAVPLYVKEIRHFCTHLYPFLMKSWRLILLCCLGVLMAAAPLLAYKILDASGDVVAPGRHCQYTSAQQCYDRTMGRQGGMSYEEITRSGTLGERMDMQYLFGNLNKITYGSDSFLFLPLWIFILLGLSVFLPLRRCTVLLSGMSVLISLIAVGHASGFLGFLYSHIFFFSYFRNLFFLGAFLIPILILLGVYQLQMLLNTRVQNSGMRKLIIVGVIAVHGLLCLFLKHFEGVPMLSYLTIGLSAAVFTAYYSGLITWQPRIWTGIFVILLILQPLWILKAYALNAREFASVLPSMHVTPVFSWIRPQKPAVSSSRIYQFVPYEDFWYDMSMTDAPARVGYPQSATRWTFDLSEHTDPDVLANYAQHKLLLYDDLSLPGKFLDGPNDNVQVTYFDVNTLRLQANFIKPQVVVYNDSYTKSWKASLDGMPVELLRANEAFKGIKVPAGKHQIEFSYHPPGGTWVYMMATAALVLFLFWTVFMLYLRRS